MIVNAVDVFLVRGVILLLPIVLTLCFRWVALKDQDAEQKKVWGAYRRFAQFIIVGTVVGWSAVSHLGRGPAGAATTGALPSWAPLAVSLSIFLFLCNSFDKISYGLKWAMTDRFRQTWWKLVDFVFPLLMVVAGFSDLIDKKIAGIAWLLAAGVVSGIGSVFLRRAEGMKLNELKSGELRNRALSIASGMGVALSRVYSVPAGKGHLTNGYGMSDAIGLTDNLGKYLTKEQKDYVIAHELAHVKLKHGRKHLLQVVTIFTTTGTLLFYLPQTVASVLRLDLVAMIAALVVYYYGSRRFEYSADREAVGFTGDPEAAISALANLCNVRELTAASDKFTELLMTHPTFAHRVRAIANRENLATDRLTEILKGQ